MKLNNKILEAFNFELSYEDEKNIYYRSYIGFSLNSKGKLKTPFQKRNKHIITFVVNKNNLSQEETVEQSYRIKFMNSKTMWLKFQLQLGLSRYLGISKYKIIPLIESGEITLNNSFDFYFMKHYLLSLGFDIKTEK